MNSIVERLRVIGKAISEEDWRELSMRVPAEPERDADLVVMKAADLLEQQAARIAELEAWRDSWVKCPEGAAAQRIKELERDNAQLKTVPMKYRRMEFNAQLQQRIEELEAQLDRLYRVGHCGSVDSFLACDDEVKRGYFAMMVEESTDNKKLREELAALRQRIADAPVVAWTCVSPCDAGNDFNFCKNDRFPIPLISKEDLQK